MDDDLFSTILYLVPVAAILFFRVFAGNKKAQAAKDRRAKEEAARRELVRRVQADLEAAGGPVPLSRISGREPESREWEPHWVTESDSDLAEAAGVRQGFEIQDEEGPEAAERLVILETERVSASTDLSSFAPSLAGKANPAPTPGEAGPSRVRDYPLTGAGPSLLSPADLSGARDAAEAAAASVPFPGSVERLPPLKRAVILSEILGPPKGA